MRKRILFIPGKNPKPEPELHHQLLSRCLVEGLRRHSNVVADEILQQNAFSASHWNHDFYGEHFDFTDYLPACIFWQADLPDIAKQFRCCRCRHVGALPQLTNSRFLRWLHIEASPVARNTQRAQIASNTQRATILTTSKRWRTVTKLMRQYPQKKKQCNHLHDIHNALVKSDIRSGEPRWLEPRCKSSSTRVK